MTPPRLPPEPLEPLEPLELPPATTLVPLVMACEFGPVGRLSMSDDEEDCP